MKSITRILFFIILFSCVSSISAELDLASYSPFESRVLEAKLEKKLADGLLEWIRHLYRREIKHYLELKTEVKLVPGKEEYTLTPWNYDLDITVPRGYGLSYGYFGYIKTTTITVGEGRKYRLSVSADFVRLFETEDALFAYAGVLAQNKKIFKGRLEDLLNEAQVTKMAEFMMMSGKNPYGYLKFVRHLYSFLNDGEEINRKVLLQAEELLDRLTGATDSQKDAFEPLCAKLQVKRDLENTIQILAKKLGVFHQFISFKVDLSENDTLGLYVFRGKYGQSLSLQLPNNWSKLLANEDRFVALILYALLWNQEAHKAKNGLWGPDSIKKLDFNVVDTLLKLDMKRPFDLDCARGYNPSEYYKLLVLIDRKPKKFAGLFKEIERALKTSKTDPNTRISAVQAYLSTLETEHADAFGEVYLFQDFDQKNKAKKSFKAKRSLNGDGSVIGVEEITEGLPSKITYEDFTSHIKNYQDNPKLDFSASQLVKLLPENELSFSVLTRFFEDEKRKEEQKEDKEMRLPISTLVALNTFLSRLEITDPSHWAHWNSVYDLVRVVGIVSQDKYPIPLLICEEWESNYLKLLSLQIEGTNLLRQDERAQLVRNLQNFRKALGPCFNNSSKNKIFKLLKYSDKVDLALMIEWDNENSYTNKSKSLLEKKGVDDLNFLESTIFLSKNAAVSGFVEPAIRKLSPEVLRIDLLNKLSLDTTHESYLKALVRRAGKIYYDAENLLKLHSFLSRNQALANWMRTQDRIRMTLAVIRQEEVHPRKILLPTLPSNQMEKIVDALSEGRFSQAESLSLIVRTNNSDLIKRHLNQKPLQSFGELIEFINKISEAEYRGLFTDRDDQYVIFRKISEQILDEEYSLENLNRLKENVQKTRDQLKLSGLNPIFFKALKILRDNNERAQVHRIWLETMVAQDSDEAEWIMENGSRKDYLKAVLAALQNEDEDLILEYPAFSSTDKAIDEVFDILMKSDLDNEFIQKWIEKVFAGKTTRQEQRKKDKFLTQLREQRPASSLEAAANFLNQINFKDNDSLAMPLQIWRNCKHLFRTVPRAEFTAEKISQFIASIKDHPNTKFPLHQISTLAVNGWYLKLSPKENTEQLVQIFENIRDTQKSFNQVNNTFCNQMGSHFGKMMRAVARQDPKLLFNSFTPASFSLVAGGQCQAKINWEKVQYRVSKEEHVDPETILSLLIHRRQVLLIDDFFSDFYSDLDEEARLNILSRIEDHGLRDNILSDLIFNVSKKEITWESISLFLSHIDGAGLKDRMARTLIFDLPKKEVTWEKVSSFADSYKSNSIAPVYAMLRLLELSEDPYSLAGIHSYLAMYSSKNEVKISSREVCKVLVSNFNKMVKGSFAYGSSFLELKEFTPVHLGCYLGSDDNVRKSIEQKYQFRTLIRAAEAGVIDREGVLIELHNSSIGNSRPRFEKAIEHVNKIKPIASFKDLETLLTSAETRRKGFKLSDRIFDQVIAHFADSEFEREKIRPVLKYLVTNDQRRILRRLGRVSHADEDMDFIVREGLALMGEKRLEKTMMGSIRQDPENLFRFPIQAVAKIDWNGLLVLDNDWYQDSFIQDQLIRHWMDSDAPKELLLAWLSFLPPETGKRNRALKHFIEKAKLQSLSEWAELVKRAEKVIESKQKQEQWLRATNIKGLLWNDVMLPYLFASFSLEPSSHEIVEFVKSLPNVALQIDKSYALNWALRRASLTKDYLELHPELLSVKDIDPPAFCKGSKYMKNYIKMILAVMNNNPDEALSFYNNPIKYLSLDQGLKKCYAILDTFADNLMENYKHWPPGMAWVWITRFIPVIAETKTEGLASLFETPPPRPRTVPTEAIIEIAARRGILSFEDIPNEIESAKAIDPSFALEPQTQKAILERLPRESFTFENLKSYADIDAVWTRQTLGESILAGEKLGDDDKKTLFELELEQRKDRPDLLENYLKTKKIITENPILTYDLENSEKMQKVFIDKMREGGAWPEENLIQQHEILFSLAKRGPSELTDELLYQLYTKDSFECAKCIRETIENHAFWDLHRRKEIYEKYLKLISKTFDEQSFDWKPENVQEYAAEIVATVNLFFPIPSMERSEILERLANNIRASEELTQQIEDEKTRGVNEDAALGLGLYLMNKVLTIYPGDHERMALVKFFVRNDELPGHIAQRFRQQVGVDRLRRQFLELPAYGKALAINALIVNLLPKRAYREELEHMIWDNVQDEFRSMAKLFYRSFVKGLQETASFQESIFVSFLLGQLANVQGSHPGEKLKYILESLGGTGISIGQKIYQRRMIPDEYLEHLKNMTDHSPLPSRKAIYDRLRKLLDVPKVSQVLSVQEILGGASTALVVRVVFNNGKEAALKMTFENLPKRTQVEFRKMEAALNHLVEDGGSMYNRLWPVIQEVHDGLRGQEDLTQECEKTATMKYLYESDSNYHDKVQFKVIKTFPDLGEGEFVGFSSEHVFMELAKGNTLTRLSEDQKKKVFPEIFKKEMGILLADPNEHGMINFEKDRHMGNFIVDFNAAPAQIFVYDYPLLSSITVKERTSLFRLIGWLEARRMYGINLLAQAPFDSKIAQILATEIAEAPLNPSEIKKYLSSALSGKAETSEKLFAIFAIIDEVGTKYKIGVRPSLISYAVALGHAERYGQFVESPEKDGAFRELLRPHVENSDKRFSRMVSTKSESVRLEETYDSFERLSEFK